MWAKTPIGVLEERPLRSAATQASCSAPRVTRPPALNCNTYQRDEVHAGVIEAVITLIGRRLAEAIEIFADGRSVVSCSPGTVCSSVVRKRESICCAKIEFRGLDR